MTKTVRSLTPMSVQLPNSRQALVDTDRGQYLLTASWPLTWSADGTSDKPDEAKVPVIYILDANAYFLTATDIVRRMQFVYQKDAVVVGIGYPPGKAVYMPDRRSLDLTPPSKKGQPNAPPGAVAVWGKIAYGGADEFHKVLENVLIPEAHKLLPNVPCKAMPQILFGHSFGGLFTLYSLFSRPGLFATYIAASPSIWFNGRSIAEENEKEFLEHKDKPARDSNLYITYGGAEEEYPRKPGQPEDEYQKHLKDSIARRMNGNAEDMAARLKDSGHLKDVWIQHFDLEDHGCAAVCGLQRGLMKTFNEWWVEE